MYHTTTGLIMKFSATFFQNPMQETELLIVYVYKKSTPGGCRAPNSIS